MKYQKDHPQNYYGGYVVDVPRMTPVQKEIVVIEEEGSWAACFFFLGFCVPFLWCVSACCMRRPRESCQNVFWILNVIFAVLTILAIVAVFVLVMVPVVSPSSQ
jgi:succinate-acetate transporter protein